LHMVRKRGKKATVAFSRKNSERGRRGPRVQERITTV